MTLKIDYDVVANIATMRRQAEMTQQELADQLNQNGAPGKWFAGNISLIESGNRGIRPGALPHFAQALGVTTEALTARSHSAPAPERYVYAPLFAKLRRRPGEWGRIASDQASASQVTRLRTLYEGAEVVSRINPSGQYDLFARYPIGNERADKNAPITTTSDATGAVTLD